MQWPLAQCENMREILKDSHRNKGISLLKIIIIKVSSVSFGIVSVISTTVCY